MRWMSVRNLRDITFTPETFTIKYEDGGPNETYPLHPADWPVHKAWATYAKAREGNAQTLKAIGDEQRKYVAAIQAWAASNDGTAKADPLWEDSQEAWEALQGHLEDISEDATRLARCERELANSLLIALGPTASRALTGCIGE